MNNDPIVRELTSHGFAWERKQKPMDFLTTARRRETRKGRNNAAYQAEYRRKLRERWAQLGIIERA